jgi:hypothetical protein
MNNKNKTSPIPESFAAADEKNRLKALFERWEYQPGSFVSWGEGEDEDQDEEDNED